jgi:putative polyhydroxyalkanoate system protein
MPDIKLHRKHQLGLAKARKIAWAWAEQVEQEFGMECTVLEGDDGDTVEFTRAGVNGTLDVTAERFDLNAKLGLLVGAFSKTIEAEIERRLDALLAAKPAAKAKRK